MSLHRSPRAVTWYSPLADAMRSGHAIVRSAGCPGTGSVAIQMLRQASLDQGLIA